MKSLFLITVVLLATQSNAHQVDDRDLSPALERTYRHAGNLIKPDRVEDGAVISGLSIQFVRIVKGVETPVEGLVFNSYRSNAQGMVTDKKCKTPTLSVTAPLKSSRYSVGPGPSNYLLLLNVKCGMAQKVVFEEKSDNAQPIAIWQTAVKAENKLAQSVSLKFWSKPIQFVWPSDGNYYVSNQVNLTLGYQWDVVAHEMGHAIYDQAKIGSFGGGEHYIDRCYTDALALSEGWASFFSAWVNLDLADPDPRFEYMVPRRAPVQIENVPSDVCRSPTNEWRVFAFLWDLIDTHDDGEAMSIPFSKLWNDTIQAQVPSLEALKLRLIKRGWKEPDLNVLWNLNF